MAAKAKVLVVDDEPLVADTIKLVLEQVGYEVERVYSGADALRVAETLTPDVLVADVMLRDTTGTAIAIELLNRAPDLKVILLSGQAETADVLSFARQAGYNFTVFPKPMLPEELIEKIEKLMENGHAAAESAGTVQ
jgi:CheY-like chemotaxis protein